MVQVVGVLLDLKATFKIAIGVEFKISCRLRVGVLTSKGILFQAGRFKTRCPGAEKHQRPNHDGKNGFS